MTTDERIDLLIKKIDYLATLQERLINTVEEPYHSIVYEGTDREQTILNLKQGILVKELEAREVQAESEKLYWENKYEEIQKAIENAKSKTSEN